MSARTITLADFVDALEAAAMFHGVQRAHRNRVHDCVVASQAAARVHDAREVARQADLISRYVKDPDTYYAESSKMPWGVRLG